MGVEAAVGETPRLTGQSVGEIHRVLEHKQTHPPRNQHQKGPIWLWVAGEVTENWQRVEQVALFLLRPLPHICGLPSPGKHLKLHPLLWNRPMMTETRKEKKRSK